MIHIHQIQSLANAQHMLRGGVIGGALAQTHPTSSGIAGLVGRTITFGNPAFSYTFVTASRPGDVLYLTDIKTQLETANPALLVTSLHGRVAFVEAVPTTGAIVLGGAGSHGRVVGTVDLNTLAYGGGGTVDTKTFKINIDGAGIATVTFVAPVNRADLVAQINAVVAGVASIDGANRLVIQSTTTGVLSTVAISNGTANADLGFINGTSDTGAATNGANIPLGLDNNNDTVGKKYNSDFITVPYFLSLGPSDSTFNGSFILVTEE